MTDRPWKPAIVRGSEGEAVVFFDEDSHGNLVDMRFYCVYHDLPEWPAQLDRWPAFDFSTDYDTHCNECGALIHRA